MLSDSIFRPDHPYSNVGGSGGKKGRNPFKVPAWFESVAGMVPRQMFALEIAILDQVNDGI